jgi:hypothetical protein
MISNTEPMVNQSNGFEESFCLRERENDKVRTERHVLVCLFGGGRYLQGKVVTAEGAGVLVIPQKKVSKKEGRLCPNWCRRRISCVGKKKKKEAAERKKERVCLCLFYAFGIMLPKINNNKI